MLFIVTEVQLSSLKATCLFLPNEELFGKCSLKTFMKQKNKSNKKTKTKTKQQFMRVFLVCECILINIKLQNLSENKTKQNTTKIK